MISAAAFWRRGGMLSGPAPLLTPRAFSSLSTDGICIGLNLKEEQVADVQTDCKLVWRDSPSLEPIVAKNELKWLAILDGDVVIFSSISMLFGAFEGLGSSFLSVDHIPLGSLLLLDIRVL